MRRLPTVFVLGFLLTILPVLPVLAWSGLGHRMVGELAQRHLSPSAKAEVATLLAGEADPSLAGVASWADALRSEDPERFKATSRWHYINAQGGGCAFRRGARLPGWQLRDGSDREPAPDPRRPQPAAGSAARCT